MQFTSSLLLSLSGLAAARHNYISPRDEMCYYNGPSSPGGEPDATCAGSDGNPHTNVLWCPTPGVADRICGSDDANPLVRDNCKRIDGAATYCSAGGKLKEQYPNSMHCFCVNGNFCRNRNAEVPGGDHPTKYFK